MPSSSIITWLHVVGNQLASCLQAGVCDKQTGYLEDIFLDMWNTMPQTRMPLPTTAEDEDAWGDEDGKSL